MIGRGVMKFYTIIAGVNGVGKSSLTGVLKESTNTLGTIIDVDKYTIEANGNPVAGGKIAVERIRTCLENGRSFTQETTLSGGQPVRTAREAKERGYTVRLYYVALDSAEDSKNRIANRVERGGHDIPSDVVDRRFLKRWADFNKILPYCDEVSLYDNSNGFVKVAEYRNGECRAIGNPNAKWLPELQQYLDSH